jgi:hypothetical protein
VEARQQCKKASGREAGYIGIISGYWLHPQICKFWDNDPTKDIYHCPDCGICR